MLVKLAWGLIEKRLKGRKVGWKYLKRVLKKAGIPLEKRFVDVKEAEEAHKAAFKAFKVAARTAQETRRTWLEGVVEALAEKHRKKHAAVMKEVISREKQRTEARITRQAHRTLRTDAGV
jgi:acyl-CoA reductase-like NAD-dependent aldehyde dehydrogenase